jgi:gamma-tubulin complex component 3
VDSEFHHGINRVEIGIDPPSADGGFDRFAGDGEDYLAAREDGLKLWETKYRFRQEMLPLFVGDAFGKKVPFYFCINLR